MDKVKRWHKERVARSKANLKRKIDDAIRGMLLDDHKIMIDSGGTILSKRERLIAEVCYIRALHEAAEKAASVHALLMTVV